MTDALVSSVPALDTKTILARINERIVLLRTWLSHDHHDEPYWWARRMTAALAQRERHQLRPIANLLHVERATARHRRHGTQFDSVEAQRAWLETRSATLALLLAGQLPL